MIFGEKLRKLRIERGLTQQKLGSLVGLNARTIARYEAGDTYPLSRETYYKLAEHLDVDVNYLLTENESFLTNIRERYGHKGQLQAEAVLGQIRELFAGGALSDADKEAFVKEMQLIFLDSKEAAKEKFTPKKYRDHSSEKNTDHVKAAKE